MGKKEQLYVSSIDTKSLTNKDILKLAQIEKDLWAYWIGEYVKCENCWKINSKNDIFWEKFSEIKKESVTKLEELLWDSIRCSNCNSQKTYFIYDEYEYSKDIKERLFESKASFISLLYNQDEIIGFMDGYIDSLKKIYKREFVFHYWEEWFLNLKRELENVKTVKDLDNLMVIAWAWTIEKYISLGNLLKLIDQYSLVVDKKFYNNTWIIELDEWSSVHWIFHVLGFKKVEMDVGLLKDKSENYNSWIYYMENMVESYLKEFLNLWIKKFLKNYKEKMKEVLKK